jgi:hypothetical protein
MAAMWMWWWIGGLVYLLCSGVWALIEHRAGRSRPHYSDGCAKPFFDRALRADGSRRPIIPRPGDGAIDDLEHLLEHPDR